MKTIVIMRSLTDGRRVPYEEFRKRGGPLVELIDSLDMEVELRLGDAMERRGVTPSIAADAFVDAKKRAAYLRECDRQDKARASGRSAGNGSYRQHWDVAQIDPDREEV